MKNSLSLIEYRGVESDFEVKPFGFAGVRSGVQAFRCRVKGIRCRVEGVGCRV